jgi:hypothetical protein
MVLGILSTKISHRANAPKEHPMNESYVDTIEKFQAQGLEAIKQVQAAQINAVSSFRELFSNVTSKLPNAQSFSNIPTVVSKISELNSTFAVKLIEQQNDYVNQLLNVLKSTPVETAETAASKN